MGLQLNSSYISLFFFGLITIIIGCGDLLDINDVQLANFDSEYAIPIIDSEFTLQEFLESTDQTARFSVTPEGVLVVIYDSEAIVIPSDLILLPIPLLIDIPLRDSVSSISLNILPGFEGERAIFKNNSIQFKFYVPSNERYTVSFSIPKLTKENEMFEITIDVDENSLGELITTEFIPLTDWELSAGFDDIPILYEAKNSADESVELVSVATRIDFLIFSYLEGSFGRQEFNVPPGMVLLNTFDNYISGSVAYADPLLRIIVDNSFGVPIEPRVNQLQFITNEGNRFDIESPVFEPGVILFDFPNFEEIGTSKRTVITLDKSNSNIEDILDEQTAAVGFNLDAIAFPNDDRSSLGYVTDESAINIRTELVLPLAGTLDNYLLSDRYLLEEIDFNNAKEIEFNLGVNNGLPIAINFQLEIRDISNNLLFNLFPNPISINSGTLDDNGAVVSSEQEVFNSSLSELQVDQMTQAHEAVAIIGMVQPPNYTDNISILTSYSVGIQLGAIINIER